MEGTEEEYHCETCGSEDNTPGRRHKNDPNGRLNICLSSSTLHEVWKYDVYITPANHIDFLTSPGARIEDL